LQVVTQIAGALFGLVLFAAAFIFTSLVLAVAAAGALILWGWILWRTRHARRAADRTAGRGETLVIEGEYVVDRDESGPAGKDPKDPRA
jgi:FtsH-binding integral membrane protein